ncbi:MAG: hypothetical protein ACXVGH_05330, partial [Mycobacteriales bacterium]
LLLGLAVLLPTGPARAATVGVSLTVQGPSPAQASARAGDTVVFTNNDAVTHTVRASGGGWSFSQAVAPGSSASHPFPAAGTYRYTDTHQVGVLTSRSDAGSVVVAAPAAPPPPPAPAPSRSVAPQPTRTPTATPRATPPPTQSPGTATAPAVGALPVPVGGAVPTASTPTPAPSPAVAPSLSAAGAAPSAVPQTGAPAGPAYAQGALTQGSAHRYGLPAALAVLALTGVVSLLVRLLLADPAAQAARRAPEPRG